MKLQLINHGAYALKDHIDQMSGQVLQSQIDDLSWWFSIDRMLTLLRIVFCLILFAEIN